jgi:uncharacterized protein YjbJ (UPF0337 family)
MNEDRVAGSVRNIGGRMQEGIGKTTGDIQTEAKGFMNQAAGAAEDAYGQAVDMAKEGAQKVRDVAVEGHDFLKDFMEDNPHTTAAIAFAIGIFIGYAAHRLPKDVAHRRPERRY